MESSWFTRASILAFVLSTSGLMAGNVLAQTTACTKGVNCYCDRVKGGDLNDPSVVFCEDFDHPALHEVNPTGPGGYGNWVSGGTDRGANSYAWKVWGSPSAGAQWSTGQPGGSPANGSSCVPGPGFEGIGKCKGMKEWAADNRWGANAYSPWVDIIAPGEFDDENGSLTPTVPGSGGAQVFGNYSLGLRNPAGVGNLTGFTGGGSWPAISQVGITAAIGYESNFVATNIWAQSWKHDEFQGVGDNGANDALLGFYLSNLPKESFPYHGMMFNVPNCASRLASAQIIKGTAVCNSTRLDWAAKESEGYSFSQDFKLNEWHCMRTYYDFRNISSVTIQMWFDNDPTPVVHITGMNLSGGNYDGGGLEGFGWNHYANTNYQAYGGPFTSVATRRYQDNLTIRNGAPASCEQIGFKFSGSTGGGTAPLAAPVLLP